jgi:nicotinate-nucleotide--dimethylbenzimidazole phosphoribosyltransferase
MMDITTGIVTETDPELIKSVKAKLDALTKPVGSLGKLENIVMQYCSCRGDADASISSAHMYVFAADHGITAEGVSLYPREVTTQMVMNMLRGGAAINVLTKNASIGCTVVDVGVDFDFADYVGLLKRKVARGSGNFLHGAAMTIEQCMRAIEVGYEIGAQTESSLFGIGEMGIGNTTAAAALSALLLDRNADETAGMGTGVVGSDYEKKCRVIDAALELHRKEWDGSPLDALRRLVDWRLPR